MNTRSTTAAAAAFLLLSALPLHAQKTQAPAKTADSGIVADPSDETPPALIQRAWRELEDAIAPKRSTDTRIAAINALSLLGGNPRAEKLVGSAIADSNSDIRLAAIVAAGEMTAPQASHSSFAPELRHLIDDPDPKVAFTAASTLWKLKDPSGEDVLIAVAEGERSADYSFWKGSKHNASRTLHSPASLAKIGATQGMLMLVPPVGIGMGAYGYLKGTTGGISPQITAITQLAHEPSDFVRSALITALADKDPGARVAAAEALATLHGDTVRDALRPLFDDSKEQVRFTGSAAYIRVATSKPNARPAVTLPPPRVRHPAAGPRIKGQ